MVLRDISFSFDPVLLLQTEINGLFVGIHGPDLEFLFLVWADPGNLYFVVVDLDFDCLVALFIVIA